MKVNQLKSFLKKGNKANHTLVIINQDNDRQL